MKKVVLAAVLVLTAVGLWGQSNEMLDEFLAAERADVATTLLLVAQAADQLPEDATPSQGYQWGAEQSFGKHVSMVGPDDPVGLGLFYLALFKTFGIKGGLMFNAVGNPRYAAMEAGYLGYVEPSRIYHTRPMPPYEVLTGISYVLDDLENEGGES